MREEMNTMDSSDLFLDTFLNDDYHLGSLNELLHHVENDADASSAPQGSSSVVQPLPPLSYAAKSRFVRSVCLVTPHKMSIKIDEESVKDETNL